MKPNIQPNIIFKNDCGCIVDYKLLIKAILWIQPDNTFGHKKIYLHGRYPAVSVYNKKYHIHRLLMSFLNGDHLPRHISVHHKDGNRLNNSISNLEIMSSGIHGRIHNKGKKLSKAHRKQISEAGKRRKGIKIKKRVNVPAVDLKRYLMRGDSINSIAKRFKCDWSTIKSRINENPELLEVSGE